VLSIILRIKRKPFREFLEIFQLLKKSKWSKRSGEKSSKLAKLTTTMASERFCVVDYNAYHGRRSRLGAIIKELAVYEPFTGRHESWVFAPPYSENTIGVRKCALNSWLETDIVKIKWTEGEIPYVLLPFILENAVSNSEFIVTAGIGNIGKAKNISGFLNDRKISVLNKEDLSFLPDISGIKCKFHNENRLCPLNNSMKVGDFVRKSRINCKTLQQVQNYYESSIPYTIRVKKMLFADPLSFQKHAKLYTFNFVNSYTCA
jgi:hypothetical protein